jgi:hypothetical protein
MPCGIHSPSQQLPISCFCEPATSTALQRGWQVLHSSCSLSQAVLLPSFPTMPLGP